MNDNERECKPVLNPADGSILGYLPHAKKEDLDAALSAAAKAFERWRWTSPLELSGVLSEWSS